MRPSAFTKIKHYLTEPLVLASSEAGDILYLYLVVSEISVNATLFKEDENWKQRPIFFLSKSLSKAETQYTCLEQATTLLVAAKKLHPYFQTHPIIVLTNLPLRSTIHKSDLSWRMTRSAIELSKFDIQYKPCLTLKGQILVDFLEKIP